MIKMKTVWQKHIMGISGIRKWATFDTEFASYISKRRRNNTEAREIICCLAGGHSVKVISTNKRPLSA